MNDKNNIKVSVVLPSYNERENIVEVIKRLSQCLGKNLYEIIVVDDNSPDGTWKIVQDMKNPKYKLIRRINERGLASALARGIREAKGNIVAWLDCDLGVPPEIIPKLVEKLKKYEVAIASRYISDGGDPRLFPLPFLSRCLNRYARVLFGSQIHDYTSGVVAVRKNVMGNVVWKDNGFGEYFAEFSYRCIKRKVRFTEVPIIYTLRKGGVSKSGGSIWMLLKYGIHYGLKMIKWRLTIR